MSFAIVSLAGHQYLVYPGSKLTVPGHWGQESQTLKLQTLFSHLKDTVTLGQPYVDRSVTAQVLSHQKGDKLHIRTYKAKSRYRKHRGYRDQITLLQIVSLGDQEKSLPASPRSPVSQQKASVSATKTKPVKKTSKPKQS